MIAWSFQKIVGTCQFRVPWFGYPCCYSSLTYVFPEYKENVVLGNGKLQLNPMSYQVIYEGKEIDLTPREFEVLYLLALKPNWVMPKTNIYHSVWGIHYHDDQIPYRTVEYVIWKIRKKMGYDIIETLVNVGYRLKKL